MILIPLFSRESCQKSGPLQSWHNGPSLVDDAAPLPANNVNGKQLSQSLLVSRPPGSRRQTWIKIHFHYHSSFLWQRSWIRWQNPEASSATMTGKCTPLTPHGVSAFSGVICLITAHTGLLPVMRRSSKGARFKVPAGSGQGLLSIQPLPCRCGRVDSRWRHNHR